MLPLPAQDTGKVAWPKAVPTGGCTTTSGNGDDRYIFRGYRERLWAASRALLRWRSDDEADEELLEQAMMKASIGTMGLAERADEAAAASLVAEIQRHRVEHLVDTSSLDCLFIC
uniref:Uncharacterized protein n=1 Tax=Aegilops tauschii subsp. strangulata TaxID=200361 RepID=A0A453AKW2_AEGTS